MCRHNSCAHLPVEEAVAIDESLLIYCKPVELYNILRPRALHNVCSHSCILFCFHFFCIIVLYVDFGHNCEFLRDIPKIVVIKV